MPRLTARMQRALVVAEREAQKRGQTWVGTEHVFLAILLDPHAIPSQIVEEIGIATELARRLEQLLSSQGYNRRVDSADQPQ